MAPAIFTFAPYQIRFANGYVAYELCEHGAIINNTHKGAIHSINLTTLCAVLVTDVTPDGRWLMKMRYDDGFENECYIIPEAAAAIMNAWAQHRRR